MQIANTYRIDIAVVVEQSKLKLLLDIKHQIICGCKVVKSFREAMALYYWCSVSCAQNVLNRRNTTVPRPRARPSAGPLLGGDNDFLRSRNGWMRSVSIMLT